jgi:hypothetical protein
MPMWLTPRFASVPSVHPPFTQPNNAGISFDCHNIHNSKFVRAHRMYVLVHEGWRSNRPSNVMPSLFLPPSPSRGCASTARGFP